MRGTCTQFDTHKPRGGIVYSNHKQQKATNKYNVSGATKKQESSPALIQVSAATIINLEQLPFY